MAQIQTINVNNVGDGLHVDGGKLKTKIDVATDNALTVTDAGLKVTLPAPVDVPTALTGATRADNTITFTKTDGSTETLELPTVPVDIHVTGLTFNPDGTVVLEVEGADPITTNLTGEIVGKALLQAPESIKGELVDMLAPLILEKIKGDELQDVSGTQMGYLLKESVA